MTDPREQDKFTSSSDSPASDDSSPQGAGREDKPAPEAYELSEEPSAPAQPPPPPPGVDLTPISESPSEAGQGESAPPSSERSAESAEEDTEARLKSPAEPKEVSESVKARKRRENRIQAAEQLAQEEALRRKRRWIIWSVLGVFVVVAGLVAWMVVAG